MQRRSRSRTRIYSRLSALAASRKLLCWHARLTAARAGSGEWWQSPVVMGLSGVAVKCALCWQDDSDDDITTEEIKLDEEGEIDQDEKDDEKEKKEEGGFFSSWFS